MRKYLYDENTIIFLLLCVPNHLLLCYFCYPFSPMDSDVVPGKGYYNVLTTVAWSLDFLMPQYYNGITQPAIDGISGTGAGSVSALSHYTTLVNSLFGGDPTRIVFGFCISDCSATGSNANANQAAVVMGDLQNTYPCNGGAFFWVALHDTAGSWSDIVSNALPPSAGCSSTGTPPPATPSPVTPTSAPGTIPPTLSPTASSPVPLLPTSQAGTCGGGSVGNGICADGTCCSEWGWCGCEAAHCINGQTCGGITPASSPVPLPTSQAGTCGGGSVGNGICADGTCCSEWGWCGCDSSYCINDQACGHRHLHGAIDDATKSKTTNTKKIDELV
jgi:hypothetical protein